MYLDMCVYHCVCVWSISIDYKKSKKKILLLIIILHIGLKLGILTGNVTF